MSFTLLQCSRSLDPQPRKTELGSRQSGNCLLILNSIERIDTNGTQSIGAIVMQNEADKMKSHTEYLTFNLPARMAFENITPRIDAIVKKSGIREGLLLCNAMHITASVFINDDESGLHEDYKKWLEGLAPFDASPQRYAHNRTGEDNADAHMKRQIMGREVVVAITNGKLDFGPWEQIFYGEFDGRRPKRVLVKVIGE